ncbi:MULTISPECIES: thiamine phosphate synthase [Methylobacterium]|jgi:thiamine-phosphate pyrophosphorylase|uniref:Thiamine phosphate synthase n=1 Tax=Methylobacterium longum TaxID=767694 RepID=A0ABT8AH70_9HYPH|nr:MULTISPECIES: thiamine phosphate synthase [Methylobacterium]MCJ2100930.1 thiamine phosphate synthase [Methylobacterium sp. E-046]MDN3569152.1 thiamine phosphate synthase [Methylobacterium longum]GJE10562.1 Thiamine-phosphate synthase [Methylobacterium longum]
MSTSARLTLLGPHGLDAAGLDEFLAALRAACGAGDVAALILRLAPADDRSLTARIKQIAPVAQDHGAALVVACPGFTGDLASVAVRGGADGIHVDKPRDLKDLRGRLPDGRILGAGGLETKHGAMEAGESGIDYLMFGGLYPDGIAPDPETVRARATWWAEIFETPCVAVAANADEIAGLCETGAEFVGLESGLWLQDPGIVARALQIAREAGA